MLHFSSCHEFLQKTKKDLELIESWEIYHMVEVQGMGANPLLVEGQKSRVLFTVYDTSVSTMCQKVEL